MSKKNFKKANITAFKDVGQEYAEKGNVIFLENINSDKLIDHPENGEDITQTADLEMSIKELGFIDPIEVTALGEGQYMIISGRRRRAAGVKTGMTVFPCLVRNFKSPSDLSKYVLFANQHRDSDTDPLLRARRYKMHEAQLKAEGGVKRGDGGKRAIIAKRMGLSTTMADRYEALSKIIEPVWTMIADGIVGISSVQKMSTHTVEEQNEILKMLNECLKAGDKLTREAADMIIEGYRNGSKTYVDVKPTEPAPELASESTSENSGLQRDKKDKKPISAETKKEQQITNAKTVTKHLEQLNTCLENVFTFASNEDAENVLNSMGLIAGRLIDAMKELSVEYRMDEPFNDAIAKVNTVLKHYVG